MINTTKATRCVKGLLAGAVLAGAQQQMQAKDLFTLTASDTVTTVTGSSNDMLTLIRNAYNAQSQFSSLNPNLAGYNGNLNYAGVANAITFVENANGLNASINIPSIGFSKSFSGTSRSDTESQIENFLKTNGASVMARFLKAMAAMSPVAVTDGNPNSTTAMAASQAYNNYAMTFAETNEEKASGQQPATSHVGVGIVADVGAFDANGFKGETYSLPLYAHFKLTDRVGLNLDMPLSYIKLESANIFGIGMGIGFPIKVVTHTKGSPWYWQLAPFGGANVSASKELVAGGLVANGGLNSLLAYDFGKVTLSMGNHFSMYDSVPVSYDGYTLDPGVSQQIIKNGLKLDIPFSRRWIVDFYAVHTKFLEVAAIDQYMTMGGELGYRLLGKPGAAKKKNGYIKFGVYADVGKNYTSTHAQFGTGWKF